MQYQSDIRGKFMYISVNVNPLLRELERKSDLRDIMPFLRCTKKVSASASETDLTLKLEMLQNWQYVFNNLNIQQ